MVLRRLDARPTEAVMVGNDYGKNILPAKACGLCTIWFAGASPVHPAPEADAVIAAMKDLPAAVEALGRR